MGVKNFLHRVRRPLLSAVAIGALLAGCEGFFDVSTRDGLDTHQIDPMEDADLIARSAFQNLATAYSSLVVFSGWWAHEALVGDSDPARNRVGMRRMDEVGSSHQMWTGLASTASIAEHATRDLRPAGGLPLVISSFTVGYTLILMAEHFCEGTVSTAPDTPGRRMNAEELIDLAIVRLDEAYMLGSTLPGEEARKLATAAQVGIARAHLFVGRRAEAMEAAARVPAGFQFDLSYVNDVAGGGRLANAVWESTSFRPSLVVPLDYRRAADAGDPRIRYQDAGRLAQDSELPLFIQLKYPGYAAPMRFASGLEARYIEVEASEDPVRIRALIDERRGIAGEGPLPDVAADGLVRELMRQRALEFWLEARKVGDQRRHPGLVPFLPAAGEPYYKPRLGTFGAQICWPVPASETANNPHWNQR